MGLEYGALEIASVYGSGQTYGIYIDDLHESSFSTIVIDDLVSVSKEAHGIHADDLNLTSFGDVSVSNLNSNWSSYGITGPMSTWYNTTFGGFTVENLYLGCARLRIELAKISELSGKTEIAISQYEKAIEIEDEYRAQFREMYPDREEIFSRLGDKKYLFAKQRIKDLRSQPSP